MLRASALACCAAAILILAAGCGKGEKIKLVPAGGTVTYQNAPLAGAAVTFVPEKGPVATAVTDLGGRFTLSTGGQTGVVPGLCRVSISLANRGEDDFSHLSESERMMELTRMMGQNVGRTFQEQDRQSALPEKYASASSSGLEFTVGTDASKNQFQIDL